MRKQERFHKKVIKSIESFRARQRQASVSGREQPKEKYYQELENILSPFWAWRSKSI